MPSIQGNRRFKKETIQGDVSLEASCFSNLFKAFRMAIHPRKMVIAFIAVCMGGGLGLLLDLLCFHDSSRGLFKRTYILCSETLHTGLAAFFRMDLDALYDILKQFFLSFEHLFASCPLYFMVLGLLIVPIMVLAGGAICRLTALEFGRTERPGLMESVHYCTARYRDFLLAPIIPILWIGLACGLVVGVGLIGNLQGAGDIIIGLSMPFLWIVGFLMMLVVLGGIGGGSMMIPSVAYEGGDACMAINNVFRFVFQQPWRYLFYHLIALLYGVVTYLLVRAFLFGIMVMTYRCLCLGLFDPNDARLKRLWIPPVFWDLTNVQCLAETRIEWIGARMIYTANLVLLGVLAAYVISFCYTIHTIIYALMRLHVDRVTFDVAGGHDRTVSS